MTTPTPITSRVIAQELINRVTAVRHDIAVNIRCSDDAFVVVMRILDSRVPKEIRHLKLGIREYITDPHPIITLNTVTEDIRDFTETLYADMMRTLQALDHDIHQSLTHVHAERRLMAHIRSVVDDVTTGQGAKQYTENISEGSRCI